LLCEGYTKPVEVKFEEVKDLIYEDLHEKKIRLAMSKEFDKLKDNVTVDNLLAGTTRAPKQNLKEIDKNLLADPRDPSKTLQTADPQKQKTIRR
jgi:hypothetical protein